MSEQKRWAVLRYEVKDDPFVWVMIVIRKDVYQDYQANHPSLYMSDSFASVPKIKAFDMLDYKPADEKIVLKGHFDPLYNKPLDTIVAAMTELFGEDED